MIDGHPVVAWIPYGRERTVSILVEYLRRDHERSLVDEVWLYMNTDPDQSADRAYAEVLAERYGFVRLLEIPPDVPLNFPHRPHRAPRPLPKQRRTIGAYQYMTDPETVYVRFDDDIVYVHDDAVTTLVRRKLDLTGVLVCFPIIWNNAIVSWWLQACGKIPKEWGQLQPYCMDPVGWADGGFAVKLHRLLLDHIADGSVEDLFTYQDMALNVGQQFSVSCFALTGRDVDWAGLTPDSEEESHITIHHPTRSKAANMVIGNALVSHYTFYPQQEVVFATDILDRYRRVARTET